MSENLLQTLQQLVEDVIALDVRELKVWLASLEKLIEVRFDAQDQRLDAQNQRLDSQNQKSDAQFRALMAAISESKAQIEVANVREISALRERVAVLESHRQ